MNNLGKQPVTPVSAAVLVLILMGFSAACSRFALPRIEVVPAWNHPADGGTPPLVPADSETSEPAFRLYL